ncbi:MAG: tetratricopeptide repeat protein, partial [Pseudomonadota bacterium]
MTVWRHTCLIFALLPAVCWGFSMENLRDLHEAGDPDATYMYAAQHFADMAGDPNFDFYYGVAAINSGRASQGVFALERVLAVVPQNLAARVELARGYFQLEEYARARAEFETAIEVGAPPSIKQRIDRYLRAIRRHEGRYQTRLEGFAELGVGHNSNVNNAPDDIDDLELTLDNPAIDDNYTVLSGGISVNAPFAVGSAFFIGLSADQFDYSDESDFNTGNVRFNTGLKFYDDTNRFRISLLGRSYSLDGDTFRDTAGLLADWRIETSQTQRINMFARVGELSYPDQELRDASTVSLGGGLTQNAT